jgi:hypothetical protein
MDIIAEEQHRSTTKYYDPLSPEYEPKEEYDPQFPDMLGF